MFNKRGKYSDPYNKPANRFAEREGPKDYLGFPQNMNGHEEEEVSRFLREKRHQKDLEDLLVKMDDTKNVCEYLRG